MFHIWQLLTPRAPEETFSNDVVTPQIAQGHAQQRAVSRTIDEHDDYEGRSRREMTTRDRILKTSAHLAADRVALRRTLQFVEDRWRAGAQVDETFEEAEKFRVDEYTKLSENKRIMRDLEVGIRDMRPENAKSHFVDAAPVQKSKSPPRSASSKPKVRR